MSAERVTVVEEDDGDMNCRGWATCSCTPGVQFEFDVRSVTNIHEVPRPGSNIPLASLVKCPWCHAIEA